MSDQFPEIHMQFVDRIKFILTGVFLMALAGLLFIVLVIFGHPAGKNIKNFCKCFSKFKRPGSVLIY